MQKILFLSSFLLFLNSSLFGQHKTKAWTESNIYKTDCIIENHGQFELLQHHVKDVKYAIQHNGDQFFFTKNGYSILVGKRVEKEEHEHEKKIEKKRNENSKEENEAEEEFLKYEIKKTWVDVEWLNTNSNVEILSSEKTNHYFSYGDAKYVSYGYKQITYKNLYNGIDVVYEIHPKGGIEYTLHVRPGADLSKVKYKYKGDQVEVLKNKKGLLIKNIIKPLQETELVAFYADEKQHPIEINYVVNNNEVGFATLAPIDKNRELILDPWVSAITTLIGTSATNNGSDVDFDAQGNLFTMGGGGSAGISAVDQSKIAKYDPNGVLLWTFTNYVASINWSGNQDVAGIVGNFVVDKNSGKIYTGQGFASAGAIDIRLTTNGIYDNYATIPNASYQETWDMKINCITGDLISLGGGTNSNLNFATIDTITGVANTTNITGNSNAGQDIANATIDANGNVYVIFASVGTAAVNNGIFKLNASYTASIWNTFTGFLDLVELDNRPYASSFYYSNGINVLAANNNYLFYYDGYNLEAFNKNTGAILGSPITISGQTVKWQCGIYTNNCDELYLGGNNGNILKYSFNGTTFSPLSSVTIPGQAGHAVYDIAFNSLTNLLYVSGDGFVATIDPATLCTTAQNGSIQLSSQVICPDTGIVTITNPNLSLSYNFIWQDSISGAIIQSTLHGPGSISDTLAPMVTNQTYKVTVIQSSSCQVLSNSIYLAINCGGTSIAIKRCPGDSYTLSNGTVISIPGVYTDTLTNSLGLDSIITITFSNYIIGTSTTNASICQGQTYTLPNGTTTSNAGVYVDTFIDIHGCDSIITLNLAVHPNYTNTINASICSNQTYTLPNGILVNSSGNYIDTFSSVFGCDSIITTNLIVKSISTKTLNASICSNQNYTLPNGQIVSTGGVYTSILLNSVGCDSIITINLIVNPTTSSSMNGVICQGDSYILPDGSSTNAAGVYPILFNGANGCDSTVFVNLTVKPSTTSTNNVTICSNDTYTLLNGTVTNNAGTYFDTLSNANSEGCDSIITTQLNVVQLPTVFIGNDTTICKWESITLNASNLNTSATYLWNDQTTQPIKIIQNQGTYVVGVNVPPCPTVSDTIVINVIECNCKITIPNAFSPNGDLTNDVFRPLFNCTVPVDNFTMHIFNRWGQELFVTHFIEEGWDGTYRTITSELGTYFYLIQFINPITKKEEIYKGDLTLVR